MPYTVTLVTPEFKQVKSLSLVWRLKKAGAKRYHYSSVVGVANTVEEAVELARPWQMKGIKTMIDYS